MDPGHIYPVDRFLIQLHCLFQPILVEGMLGIELNSMSQAHIAHRLHKGGLQQFTQFNAQAGIAVTFFTFAVMA